MSKGIDWLLVWHQVMELCKQSTVTHADVGATDEVTIKLKEDRGVVMIAFSTEIRLCA
jgi:hypothetical protein